MLPIESANKRDLGLIRDFLNICELPSNDLSPTHLEHFFIICQDEKIIGSVGLEIRDRFGLLRSLAVANKHRRLGLGIKLTHHIEGYAQIQGIKTLYLLTTTAQKFFAKIGYEVIEREMAPAPLQETAEFKNICPTSAICMQKDLFQLRNHEEYHE